MSEVITELREFTKLTSKEEALNETIAISFNQKEQKKLHSIIQGMLVDEFVHVMALMQHEKMFNEKLSDSV